MVEATPQRRSARVAKQQLAGLSAEQRAQVVLAKRVGLITKDMPLWKEAMTKINELFNKELSMEEIKKVASLFKIVVPEVMTPGTDDLGMSVDDTV